MTDKALNKLIQTPAIAELIRTLDKLGYELYIKPKPLRSRNLQADLRAAIEDASIMEGTRKKVKSGNKK